MTTLNYKLVIFILIFSASSLFAQPGRGPRFDGKMLEKIEVLKREKLVELLKLEGERKEKFLKQYTERQKGLLKSHMEKRELSNELRIAIKDGKSADELAKMSDKILIMHDDMQKSRENMLKYFKGFLNKEEYAKYLVFELNFSEEIRRRLMHQMREKRRKENRDGRGRGRHRNQQNNK